MAKLIFRLTWAIWALAAILGCLSQYGPWSDTTVADAAAQRPAAALVARAPASGAATLRANASYNGPSPVATVAPALH